MFSICSSLVRGSSKLRLVLTPLRYRSASSTSTFSRGLVDYFFRKNLLLTNSVTSGGFMALADYIQQEFEFRSGMLKERYDWIRMRRMFIVGFLLGPLHHYYYKHLDKLLPKSDVKTVLIKIFCDQLFASPLTILLFFSGMGVLENKSNQEIKEEIENKFKMAYIGDWVFWPPVQWVNFYYLPTQYRVFYINIATMVFDVFLSFMKHAYDK